MHKIIENIVKKALVKSTLLALLFVFAQPLHALEFECNAGTDRRFIRMELPGIQHLCEVSVTYTSKASKERKVMWYANNDSLFCSSKTNELRNKYESKWDFTCKQWPDHDGVDQLNNRQRNILDSELKALTIQGKNAQTPFLVEGLKVAASPTSARNNDTNLLVVQFFLHVPETGFARDVTHIIKDEGTTWNTLSKIDSLANHIETDESYVVNSALISGVTGNGALEVITVLDSPDPTGGEDDAISFSGCYGNQTLTTADDGKLVARTPHRYYCPDNKAAEAG